MTIDPGNQIRLERSYDAPVDAVWELWTTAAGIESWWAPEGFEVEVQKLDLRPGGELVYTMTATAPAQIEFMQGAGMPLTTASRKAFTEIVPPRRIAYQSLVDFVPGIEPYEFLTVVEFTGDGNTADVVMTVQRMHDDVWTERMRMGRENELENLGRVITARA